MLMDKTVNAFVEELASSSPAPGGGSVAALCGALGAALVAMVCRLTVGKPKYAQVNDELSRILLEADQLQKKFSRLVEQDTEAFNAVMAAFRLPKETEDQKAERSRAIQEATRGATEVPLEVHALSARLLELTHIAAQKGNVNSVSDAGVAAEMARAAAQGAAMNVQINLGGLKDASYVAEAQDKVKITGNKINELYVSLNKMVDDKLS